MPVSFSSIDGPSIDGWTPGLPNLPAPRSCYPRRPGEPGFLRPARDDRTTPYARCRRSGDVRPGPAAESICCPRRNNKPDQEFGFDDHSRVVYALAVIAHAPNRLRVAIAANGRWYSIE